MDEQQTSESGTELQGTEELRVRPRRGEQVRRDLQGGQVLAREEQERIHCPEVSVQERYEVRGYICCVSSYCIACIFPGYKFLRKDRYRC